MSEIEAIKAVLQLGQAAVFFWLFMRSDAKREEQDKRHDADIQRLYELRVSELKLMARLPTDLEGVPGARVPA